jgi:hypothetical protein
LFDRLEQVSNAIRDEYGLRWDTPIAARAMVAMVATMATLDDVLYPLDNRPDRARIVDELTRILIGAAGLLPPPPKKRRRAAKRR